MSGEHRVRGARVAIGALFVLSFAPASSARDLLHCEDFQGRQFVTQAPRSPPGSSYLGRHPARSPVPALQPGTPPGKLVPGANALEPADAARVARAVRMVCFHRALAGPTHLRFHAMAHYEDSEAWPTRPEQLGLDPETLFSEDIAQVDFPEDGTIEAPLRPDFGEDKRIWLRPELTLGGAQTHWACRTNLRLEKPLLVAISPRQSIEGD